MSHRSIRYALVFAISSVPTLLSAQPSPVAPEAAARTVELAASPEPEVEGFVRGGLTADEAAARAVANAPSLARADAAVRVAEAGSIQALASVIPTVTLTGRASYTNRIVNNLSTSSQADRATADALVAQVTDPSAQLLLGGLVNAFSNLNFPYFRSQYELSAQVSYPLTASLLTALPLYRAAGLSVDAARVQRDADLAVIALRAREAFYEHVRARGALVVANEAVEAVRAHRDQVAALVEAGVAARADLLQVEAQLASADVAVRNTELGVAISARALGILIAADDEAIPQIQIGEDVSLPVDMPTGTIDELETRALSQRPEMLAIASSREARSLEMRAHGASRMPQVALNAGVQYMNPNTRYIPQTRTFRTSWDLSAVITWSPNEAMRAEGRRRQASAALDQLDAQELELRDGVRLEVTQAYQQLHSAHATVTSAAAAVAAAEEAYRVRSEQLAHGVIVSVELADARTTLTRARLELVDSSVQVRIASARLRRALGESSDVP